MTADTTKRTEAERRIRALKLYRRVYFWLADLCYLAGIAAAIIGEWDAATFFGVYGLSASYLRRNPVWPETARVDERERELPD